MRIPLDRIEEDEELKSNQNVRGDSSIIEEQPFDQKQLDKVPPDFEFSQIHGEASMIKDIENINDKV